MKSQFLKIIFYIAFIINFAILADEKPTIEDTYKKSIVQIRVTTQQPNFLAPWQFKKPITSSVTGSVVPGNKILVFASNIEYFTSIEVKKFSSSISIPAKVVKIDYEANLALIEPEDKNFFADLVPIKFEGNPLKNKSISVIQMDNSGTIQVARGRITAVDMEFYPIGHTELPYILINSNEKLEGNGEVVLEDEKVAGVLYRFSSGKNTGKVVPTFIIKRFLESEISNEFSSFPFKGFRFKSILDSASKEYYGLGKKSEGILVTEVIPYSGAENILKENDVIIEFGKMKLDAQGYFQHPNKLLGKQSLGFLAHSGEEFGYILGKSIPIKLLRDKKVMEVEIPLKPFPYNAIKIPYMNNAGSEPKFLIQGGFIFTELTEFLLREFGGNNWRARIDKKLLFLSDYYRLHKKEEKGRYIIIIQVMPDDYNNGYHNFNFEIIKTVNDTPITSIKELDQAFKSKSEFIKIELENGYEIGMEMSTLPQANERIMKKFNLNRAKNF